MMNDVPRMRTIHQAAEELKAADSSTALSERELRRAVNIGLIPSVRVGSNGSRRLVDMKNVYAYLSSSDAEAAQLQPSIHEVCGIRRIG